MIKKILVTIVVLISGISGYILFSHDDENAITDDGEITVIIVDENGESITKTIEFEMEDTLFELLDEHYDVTCADRSYMPSDECVKVTINGRVLLGLDDVTTDWSNTYLAIFINDTYSTKGIDLIPLEDGNEYRFEYRDVGGAFE